MRTVKINDIPNEARAFARSFDNEEFRLVRSQNSFEKFASAEFGETKVLRSGDIANEDKKRVAYWWSELGYGVICNKADFETFVEYCKGKAPETKAAEKPAGKKRGRPAKSEKSEKSENGSKVKGPKKRGPKKVQVNAAEPDLTVDYEETEYTLEQNLHEIKKAIKKTLKHYDCAPTLDEIFDLLPNSQNLKDLFEITGECIKPHNS